MKYLFISLLSLVVACSDQAKPKPFNSDSAYLDSLFHEHVQQQPITSDTATPGTQREYDSLVKAQEAADSAYQPFDTGYVPCLASIMGDSTEIMWQNKVAGIFFHGYWHVKDRAAFDSAKTKIHCNE
jgi:hypothetical protein